MPDLGGRPGVSWTQVVLRLPDDGTGALPLLRHVILNDQKAATYKLGLLRVLCRAADSASGMARDAGDDHVGIPLGLAALIWVRLYLPLIERGLPQSPTNRGPDGLGFVKTGFRALLAGVVPRLDLRVGTRLTGQGAQAVHTALQDAADTMVRMPANYMTCPNGGAIVLAERRRQAFPPTGAIALDATYLGGFGELRVPREVWRALQRFAAWVEPALIAEWVRLMQTYAMGQKRTLEPGAIGAAMTWAEPARDVAVARERALELLSIGQPLNCVWTGRRLEERSLDIDHCLPWSAWACGDLWNLLPAHRVVNQREKRDRLPSAATLRAAREPILDWWQQAYTATDPGPLPTRFVAEARASLPGLGEVQISGEDVFVGVGLQRLRLHNDQQVPEWIRKAEPRVAR